MDGIFYVREGYKMHILFQVVMPLVLIFAVKVLENMLDATKILCLQKGKHVLSGVVLTVVILINYTIMKKIVSSDTEVMIVAAVGAGIGYTIAGYLGERFLHSSQIEIIMTDNSEAISEINDFLSQQHIRHIVTETYNKDMSATSPTIMAFPDTKAKHRAIVRFLNDSNAKLRHVVIG